MQNNPVIRMVMVVALLALVSSCRSGCQRQTPSPSAAKNVPPVTKQESLLDRVEQFTLSNGMQWILLQRGDAPVFSGAVYVKAGGMDEPPGKAGIAHMFEHMAFKGTRALGTHDFASESKLLEAIAGIDAELLALADGETSKREALVQQRADLEREARQYVDSNEIWQIFQDNGAATLNAGTSKDFTFYYASMPSHRLGLWAYLTSEMIFHPAMREFYSERDVVMEERRQRVDNPPDGQMYEALMATAFEVSPYQSMTIGSMEELQGLTVADARKFHKAYYAPSAMVGAIIGNFDVATAKVMVERFFGAVPHRDQQPLVEVREEPAQDAERRVDLTIDAAPSLFMAYHKPTAPHRDDYVFDALQYLLCSGETARMRRRVVHELRVAESIDCFMGSPGARLSNLFMIIASPVQGVSHEELIAAIESVFEEYRQNLFTTEDLDIARTNLRSYLLWGMHSNADLAAQLAQFHLLTGDWRYIVRHEDVMNSITPEDLQSAVQRYLNPSQRTIVTRRRPK